MNHTADSQERRRHTRVDYNIPLKLSAAEADFVTETKNLSCSGTYCRVDQYIEPMTKVAIHLLLPVKKGKKSTTAKIKCGGVVVRTESAPSDQGYDVAIFFNDIDQKDIATLTSFVEGLVSSPSE